MQWRVIRKDATVGRFRFLMDDCMVCESTPAPYLLLRENGDAIGALCLSCAMRPCDPDCTQPCCQHGGIDRNVALFDGRDLEPKEIECKKCNGSGAVLLKPDTEPVTCWVCQGDGVVTIYVDERMPK